MTLRRIGPLLLLFAGCMPPSWAANALVHPGRNPPTQVPHRPFELVDLEGAGVHLKGWRFRAQGPVKRGTVVYLHGIGDSRRWSPGIADHFAQQPLPGHRAVVRQDHVESPVLERSPEQQRRCAIVVGNQNAHG